MSVDERTLRPLRADELAGATELCVRAFATYPYLAALYPGPPARREAIARRFYGATIADALEHGRVDAADVEGRVAAVAAWLPPGAWPQSLRRSLAFLPVALAALRRFPRRSRLGIQSLVRLERNHPADPPHWYLAVIAVDPAHQRRGLGSAVIRPALDLADAQGHEAFLETADPDNAAWYARLGFDTETEEPCFDGGPPQWFMRRQPQAPLDRTGAR